MKLSTCLLPALLCASSLLWPTPGRAADLTQEQIANIRKKLETIQSELTSTTSSRNQNAGSVFATAAQSERAAVDLYIQCVKEVNFAREGREDSDFRVWEENQRDNFKDPQFLQGLIVQLRYLALSCQAAEAEKISDIFSNLTSYVDGLSNLSEEPNNLLLSPVGGSVFAKAYNLDAQLARNGNWEPVPFNISGIYDRTILPYLREQHPEQLMAAWDRRIDQQTRIVSSLDAKKQEALKGGRDDRNRTANQQRQREQGDNGKILREHDKDDFIRDTLPNLKWSKLKDQFEYVSQVDATLAMLSFLQENLTNPKADDWLNEFNGLIDTASGSQPAPSAPAAPQTSTPTAPPASQTSADTPGGNSGAGLGLEPVN